MGRRHKEKIGCTFAIAYPPNVDVIDGLLAVGWLSRIIYVLRFYDANPPYQKTAPSRQPTKQLLSSRGAKRRRDLDVSPPPTHSHSFSSSR